MSWLQREEAKMIPTYFAVHACGGDGGGNITIFSSRVEVMGREYYKDERIKKNQLQKLRLDVPFVVAVALHTIELLEKRQCG
ncbi:Hypothetical predicted protein [Octopus vulgaris]|uniref:Uncharacterized protein n=1 Tax=Octopus vulgaris TaxID=6645 RepID=A0AA36BSL6_OCTVU|nr:Hypothetical predicted protein [Octopus vulgaris]